VLVFLFIQHRDEVLTGALNLCKRPKLKAAMLGVVKVGVSPSSGRVGPRGYATGHITSHITGHVTGSKARKLLPSSVKGRFVPITSFLDSRFWAFPGLFDPRFWTFF
jgi:hypothetical protein